MGQPTISATPPRRHRVRAAWVLMALTLICAELTFLAVAVPFMWALFPLLFPMYGAGVLLIRELVVRTGGGWPSLIIMGLVYELVEDAFGLQALTSEVLYGAADWGPRVLGINTTYWEVQIGYHIVFSVLIPVMITNLIFPDLRAEPYLKRGGMIITAVTAVIGVALVRVVISGTQDPGYQAPWVFLAVVTVIIVVLSYLALRVLPRRSRTQSTVRHATRVPKPVLVGIGSLITTVAFIGLLMPLDNDAGRPALGDGPWVYLAMVVAAGLAVGAVLVLRRWSAAPAWTDRHRIWLIGGSLVGHTLFIVIATVLNPVDESTMIMALTVGPAMIIITVLSLARLARTVQKRAAVAAQASPPG